MKKLSAAATFAVIGIAFATMVAWGPSARADGTSVPYGHGGMRFPQMDKIIAHYNSTGERFRIEGECHSSCTELLAIKNVCIAPSATLKFHAALARPDQPLSAVRNARMASYYNSGLRNFVLAHHFMDSWQFHAISGREMIEKFGYRRCP